MYSCWNREIYMGPFGLVDLDLRMDLKERNLKSNSLFGKSMDLRSDLMMDLEFLVWEPINLRSDVDEKNSFCLLVL
ncbi:hypothetical protein Leryth_023414 [Lithospermum erythrorhizon]|nr:hypothetical protein Leryth_023414 [Lithospermum erythrorhizon]